MALKAAVIRGEMTQKEADERMAAAQAQELFAASQEAILENMVEEEKRLKILVGLFEKHTDAVERNGDGLWSLTGGFDRLSGQIGVSMGLLSDMDLLLANSGAAQMNYRTNLEDIAAAARAVAAANKEAEDETGKLVTIMDLENQGIQTRSTFNLQSHEAVMARLKAEQRGQEWMTQNQEEQAEIKRAAAEEGLRNTQLGINAAMNLSDVLFKDAQRQYKVQKSLAVAETAFGTASAVMEAAPNPWAIASVISLGVAQAASIASQTPPTAHMGLFKRSDPLAPDEMMTKVLEGEAILDRAAVNRLGGEQGIRAINTGASPVSSTTVVVPWKHLDREIGRSARADSRLSRAMRRANRVGNGQRGW